MLDENKVYSHGEFKKQLLGKRVLLLENNHENGILATVSKVARYLPGVYSVELTKKEHTKFGPQVMTTKLRLIVKYVDEDHIKLDDEFWVNNQYIDREMILTIFDIDPDALPDLIDMSLSTRDERAFYIYTDLLSRYNSLTKGMRLLTVEDYMQQQVKR